MAHHSKAADRIDQALRLFPSAIVEKVSRKKMFGGLSFLYEGRMAVGLVKEDLAVRVVADKMDAVMKKQHVRAMDFTKRPVKEFIYVAPAGYSTEEQLQYFLELGLEHAMQGNSINKSSKP
jgi:TfoX/Sxy family transcriptional regulator of competence genes